LRPDGIKTLHNVDRPCLLIEMFTHFLSNALKSLLNSLFRIFRLTDASKIYSRVENMHPDQASTFLLSAGSAMFLYDEKKGHFSFKYCLKPIKVELKKNTYRA
jgi:hypothetical protein